jgi:hypothetical protein
MTSWKIVVPNGEYDLTTEELAMWARARKIGGDTRVVDERGESWAARQVPEVFSKREWIAALLISIFVGVLGVDRFYLGKVGTGILKLLTFGGLSIWALIDVILIALKRLDDKEGLPLA